MTRSRSERPLLVVALGGNALLRRGESLDAQTQKSNVERATTAIASLAVENDIVVTHGNGPQIGLLALQDAAYTEVEPYPLDVLGAESEGMIGYLLEEGFRSVLPDRATATLLTQVAVYADDQAFEHPTKPVGPAYEKAEAEKVAMDHGWTMAADGDRFRRVVPSPEPREILELSTISLLVAAGALVVCAGGGGVPVVIDDKNAVRGVEAVIDKDLSSALLATQLRADFLLLLTDVPGVEDGWGTKHARTIPSITPEQLRTMRFEAGSMGPKVEAVCRFVEATGRVAAIGSLDDAAAIVDGSAGTRVERRGSDRLP